MTKLMISPLDVKMDVQGYISTSYMVRLPEGMLSDDLRDPAVWEKVAKAKGIRIRKFDTMMCVAFDESFALSALVTEAKPDSLVIAFAKVHDLAPRTNALFNDGTHRLRWDGAGFGIERISDGVRVSPTSFVNEQLAIFEIQQLYTRAGT